ncbi:MAG: hypothetical protein K2L45_02445 [Muribaculaceae bacterium]|nr:hypothetical protein [Muribaculaceae bacterium]
MKKLILLFGLTAINLSGYAEQSEPMMIENAAIKAISPNGKFAVSQGSTGLRILELSPDNENSQYNESDYEEYYSGDGNCVSDNGVVVASTPNNPNALYWKDGEWHSLQHPSNALTSNHAQGISADGSRICGNLRISGMGNDDDVLMVIPCVWNAEGNGYGKPVLLPHPDLDYADRVPQYITAIDISADGKVIVGQIRDAQGILNYPIIYKENENGEWSYDIPYEYLINPDKLEIVPYPGEGPAMPQFESFMTSEEIEAYNIVYNEYVSSGYQIPCPEYWEFMTPEEIAAYNEAADIYNEKAIAYNKKFEAWADFIFSIIETSPSYAFNQVRISPDGKTIGCTVEVTGERDPLTGFPSIENSVWLLDLTCDKISKYDKDGDLNIYYIANNGIGIGTTSAGTASNSYILQDENVIDIVNWMNSKVPEYASWIKENMIYQYEKEVFDEKTGNYDLIYTDDVLTGRATATPDFSIVSLSVENIWDGMDDGIAYIFDLKAAGAVNTVRTSSEEMSIYDLAGRKLKSATAPGIYIINGEKKVVR